MSENTLEVGDHVLVNVEHLHGVAAEIVGKSSSIAGEFLCKLTDPGYRGQIVQFAEDELTAVKAVQAGFKELDDKHPLKAAYPDADYVLDLNNHDRMKVLG